MKIRTRRPKLGGGALWYRCVRQARRSAILDLFEIEERRTVLVDELEHTAAAARNAGERIFGYPHAQPEFVCQAVRQSLQ